MQKFTKYFNTSGPNIPSKHYTLMRSNLIALGQEMVYKKQYFEILAPRQSGKSTYFRFLCEALNAEGYTAVHFSVEGFSNFDEASILASFCRALQHEHGLCWNLNSFEAFQQKIESTTDLKLVIIIDEIESFNPLLLNQFLHIIRNLYHNRETHCLHALVLVGVINISGIVQDNASPFNIADTLQIDYFTREEVFELLGMHELATQQLFAAEVKNKIYEITAGQPGLVNGFAQKLTNSFSDKAVIGYDDYLTVEDWYLYEALDKNVYNVINKAKHYQAFMEELLFTEKEQRFDIDNEQIRFLYVNGILKRSLSGNIEFWVPLYKKRLQKFFYPAMNGEAKYIQSNIWWEDYFTDEGQLNIEKIIREYQVYCERRGFRPFFEKDEKGNAKGLKEAALVYSFETYIQSFLLAVEGKSYLEAHVALGRSDLIVNVRSVEFVIETKVYYDVNRFLKGKVQLAYYVKNLGLKTGVYLVFVGANVTHHKVAEAVELIEGVEIRTYLVRYDLKVDFEQKEED